MYYEKNVCLMNFVSISGFNVLFQDVDLVWFRDPLPYLRKIIDEDAANSNGLYTGMHRFDSILLLYICSICITLSIYTKFEYLKYNIRL